MQQPALQSKTTLISTLCGTFLSVFNNISSEDMVRTAVLAAIGAATSFLVSVSCKAIFRKLTRNKGSV